MRFGWRLYKLAEPKKDEQRIRRNLDALVEIKSQRTIEIKPATDANIAIALQQRQVDFAESLNLEEERPDQSHCIGGGWDQWVETIEGCRHKEFVPFLLRGIDRVSYSYYANKLITSVYESYGTTEECFADLANHLSTGQPEGALGLFHYWTFEDDEHESSLKRQAQMKTNSAIAPDKKTVPANMFLEKEEEAWRNSKRHLDTRLTPDQFRKLRSIKNVWVRALLYAHYPQQCPADWVETLVKDFKKLLEPPKGIAELVAKLDDDNYAIREQATKDLFERCRSSNLRLLEVNEEKLSIEAKGRLERIRATLKKAQLPVLWTNTITHFCWNRTRHTDELFDILRTGNPDSLISQAARKEYEERVKREKERNERSAP